MGYAANAFDSIHAAPLTIACSTQARWISASVACAGAMPCTRDPYRGDSTPYSSARISMDSRDTAPGTTVRPLTTLGWSSALTRMGNTRLMRPNFANGSVSLSGFPNPAMTLPASVAVFTNAVIIGIGMPGISSHKIKSRGACNPCTPVADCSDAPTFDANTPLEKLASLHARARKVVGPHRAGDGAARVLRQHQFLQISHAAARGQHAGLRQAGDALDLGGQIALDAGGAALGAAGGSYGVAWLVDMEFSTGTIYFTNAPLQVNAAGNSYLALGSFVDVGNLQESADTAADRLSIALSVASSAMLAAAMGDPATYRGRAARLYLQLFDERFQPAGARVLRWQGYMDKLQISRTPAGADGTPAGGRIEMLCSRAGMARARRAEGLRLTDQQQQSRYPGDTGLRYVRTLIEQPALWLSKRFQQQ